MMMEMAKPADLAIPSVPPNKQVILFVSS